ncbi:MAG: ABC transporter permease [Candidatus Methanomethyliaceae archaeon]
MSRLLPIVLLVVFVCGLLLWPLCAGIDAYKMNVQEALRPPSRHHWFGTDVYGRDIFARTVVGARTTLGISATAVFMGIIIGLPLGLVPLFSPALLRELLRRFTDLMLAWPGLFLALALMGVLGPGERNLVIALGVVRAPRLAILLYNTGRQMMAQDFIDAAKAAGAGSWRIAYKHVLPNLVPTLIPQFVFQLGSAITAETALSFLGVGVLPPKPSWGNLVADGKNFLQVAPWISLLPGAFLVVFVLFVNLSGDVLIDLLTPKRR